MSSAKKRTPARITGGTPAAAGQPGAAAPAEYTVVPTPSRAADRLLLAAPDMTALGLLPDDVVIVSRLSDGAACWRGGVWPQRGLESATLAFPLGCSQVAVTGSRVRFASESAGGAIRPAPSCAVSFADGPRSSTAVSAGVLLSLRTRMAGCILPPAGLLWTFDESTYLVTCTPSPAADADAPASYVAAKTVFRWQARETPESTSELPKIRPCLRLGGLDAQIASLTTLVSEALFHPGQFAHYGLQPTR